MLSLLALVGGLTAVTFDAVPVLLASVLTFLLARNEAPVLDDVGRRFVAPSPGASSRGASSPGASSPGASSRGASSRPGAVP